MAVPARQTISGSDVEFGPERVDGPGAAIRGVFGTIPYPMHHCFPDRLEAGGGEGWPRAKTRLATLGQIG